MTKPPKRPSRIVGIDIPYQFSQAERIALHKFDIVAYVASFDFQTKEEKQHLYKLLQQIWYENYGHYGE